MFPALRHRLNFSPYLCSSLGEAPVLPISCPGSVEHLALWGDLILVRGCYWGTWSHAGTVATRDMVASLSDRRPGLGMAADAHVPLGAPGTRLSVAELEPEPPGLGAGLGVQTSQLEGAGMDGWAVVLVVGYGPAWLAVLLVAGRGAVPSHSAS